MESKPGGAIPPTDPAADLELLNRSKSIAELDQMLDSGPWWYAPMFATVFGGWTLAAQGLSNSLNVAGLLAGIVAVAVVSVHDYRRRRIWTDPSARSLLLVVPVVLVIWFLSAAWGSAVSTLGYEEFVPGYAVLAWLLTTVFLLGVRFVSLSALRRRGSLI